MKHLHRINTALLLTLLITPVFAASTPPASAAKIITATDAPKTTTTQTPLVVYSEPNAQSKTIANSTPLSAWIPIHQQGEWLKVGNSANGEIGYVNNQQFQQALNKTSPKSDVQTVFVQANRDQGSDNYNVVAYQNGQRLSDTQAQAMFAKMQKQQQSVNQQMQTFQQNMNTLMAQQMQALNQTFAAASNINSNAK